MNNAYVQKARDFAQKVHKGHKRRDGSDYFQSHLVSVAELVGRVYDNFRENAFQAWENLMDVVVAAAFLHDSVEDGKTTLKELEKEGFSKLTVSIVDIVSKREGENYFDFIMRIKNSGCIGAMIVKVADLTHNMSDLEEGSMKDKYRFAYHELYKHLK